MKLLVCSDLHWEFLDDMGQSFADNLNNEAEVDVLILAGDIIPLAQNHHTALLNFKILSDKFDHIVYVLGNHCLYHSNPPATAKICDTLRQELPNLHIFDEPGECTVLNQKFICGTGWFPKLDDTTLYDKNCMADFSVIRLFEPWVYEQNGIFNYNLQKNLIKDDVVVMHHLPSYKSVHSQYARSRLNRFFVNNIENLIIERQPKLIIHGHTHMQCDYKIGDTRIIANPHGYPNENRTPYKPRLIEI